MATRGCFETRHDRNAMLDTHRHGGAYAALVLDGSHAETSADGVFECTPGTLLLHPHFHAHGNRFGRQGARVINIALPAHLAPETFRALQVPHLADAREVFQHDPGALETLIAASREQPPIALPDWQPALLQALASTNMPIGDLCRRLGVSAAHASRALLRSHGMAPQLLRRELRWRAALSLLRGNASLAEIAAQSGFADQSHLTRVVRHYAGVPPAVLRRQIQSAPGTSN